MSIQHTVVFRLIHTPGSPEEADFLDSAQETLAAIDGVTGFAINRQVGSKSALAHQFSMFFADQSAYDAYNEAPAHRDFVASRWASEVAEFQEYDFIPRDSAAR